MNKKRIARQIRFFCAVTALFLAAFFMHPLQFFLDARPLPPGNAKPAPIVVASSQLRLRPPFSAQTVTNAPTKEPRHLSEKEAGVWQAKFHYTPPRERDDIPPQEQILLQSRLIVTTGAKAFFQTSARFNRPTSRGTVPMIAQFRAPVTAATRASLAARGAVVHGYLPHRALLIEATESVCAQLAANEELSSLGEFLPDDKLQPFLAFLATNVSACIDVTIVPTAMEDVPSIAEAVTAKGGKVVLAKRVVWAEVPPESILSLAESGAVSWMEYRAQARLLSDLAHNTNHLDTRPLWDTWGLTGKGQIAAHSDSGIDTGTLDTLHPDLAGVISILPLDPRTTGTDTFGHGTHTAGLIIGNGTCSANKYRGTAWGAKLVHEAFYTDSQGSMNGGLDDIYNNILAPAYAKGGVIHSASWGFGGTAGSYTLACAQCDTFAWDNPDSLMVIAAGNSGLDANANGVIDAESIYPPASAKSLLTVGAAENDRVHTDGGGYSSYPWGFLWSSKYKTAPIKSDYVSESADGAHQGMAAFSSRGPVLDGRIKPDIVAPGTDIISTRSSASSGNGWGKLTGYNNRYLFNGGTSMATPLAAGGAILMRQYAMERAGIARPSGALIKAMLIDGARSLSPGQYGTGAAREIPETSPNNVEGWGELDLADSVHPVNQMVRLLDDIRLVNGATNVYKVALAEAGSTLAATLVWIDYPASVSAAATLVNDYDLQLLDPSGATVFANGLTVPDRVNPVEKILVTNALSGTYTFRVIAHECPYSPDEGGAVALVLRGAFEAAPIIVHSPPDFIADVSSPQPVDFKIQALGPLTNAGATVSMLYAAGTADVVTGAWGSADGSWLSNACYQADLPAAGGNLVWHYQFIARVSASLASTSAVYTVLAGAPLPLIVKGNPAAYGTPDPGYGTNILATGARITLSAPGIVADSSTLRHRCRGYVGDGEVVPFYGATNTVTITATADASITWAWLDQYLLTEKQVIHYSSKSTGTVTLGTSWYDAGTSASTRTIDALLYNSYYGYFGFAGWEVDDIHHSENPVAGLTMNAAVTATASYLPFKQDTGGDGLYDWWTKRYFNTTTNLDENADGDQDGFSNLAECYDNTDPSDASSHPVPPSVTLHAIAAFQTNFPPWTVTADVTDNFIVTEVNLYWREDGDTNWNTVAMSQVSGPLFSAAFTPASFGAKRVEYRVGGYDLLGQATANQFGTVSDSAYVIGYYSAPAAAMTPGDTQLYRFTPTAGTTNATFAIQNLAGPDLLWTARYANVLSEFSVTNAGWSADGWVLSAYRSEDGSTLWYCGNDASHTYANGVAEHLITPAFTVPTSGGFLVFHHWIKTEIESAADKTAWDGGILSVSADHGETWTKITPTGGYPYKLMQTQNALFSTDEAIYAGDGSDGWQIVAIPLGAYAGQTLRFRFSFGSDLYTDSEGWYIGHVALYTDTNFPVWFQPTGETNGTLAARATASLSFTVSSSGLTPHSAKQGLLYVASNAASGYAPQTPLTFELGNTLTLLAGWNGTLTADHSFLFAPLNSPVVTATGNAGYNVADICIKGPTNLEFSTNASPVVVTLKDVRTDTEVIALFKEIITAHNLPATWLIARGFSSDFDAAEQSDPDGDGLATWQEYFADTDPTNVDSTLKFIAATSNTLTWIGGRHAEQILEAAPTPTGVWSAVSTYTPPTPNTNNYPLIQSGMPQRFYRVKIKY